MAHRFQYIESIEDAAKLSLEQLNALISRYLYDYNNGGTSQGRKSAFKQLVSLESFREELHNIPAPKRRF